MAKYEPSAAASDVVEAVQALYIKEDAIGDEFAPPKLDAMVYLHDGELKRWGGAATKVESCVLVQDAEGNVGRLHLGTIHKIDTDTALAMSNSAEQAFDLGRGAWPRASVKERLDATERFVVEMEAQREPVVRMLMWEIGKSRKESENEFDRTVDYIRETIASVRQRNNQDSRLMVASGHVAQIRRSPLGVVLSMGPFNYPLNETFTTLIPALIMGNTAIAKLPRHGALSIVPLFGAFQRCFPKGVVNIFNGRGAETAGPIIRSGILSSLAFIGSSTAANRLRVQHPKPSRMRCTLGLDAKNAGIVLRDADIDNAVKQVISGTLSFQGQRCTAIKIVFVHARVADQFVEKLAAKVDAMKPHLPWAGEGGVCPLPEYNKVASMQAYVDDALAHGAKVVNKNGGVNNETFYFPSVVYPVNKECRLYLEEQFGPVVPVVRFELIEDVIDYIATSSYGQQVSLFGEEPATLGPLIDILVNMVCRVNLNGPCKRGPDCFPFTARKDSAEGTLDIESATRAFSIRTMVAAPITQPNRELVRSVITDRTSEFLNNDCLF
eukprot:TRINITY_DN5536_c0_g1_i1.p1 TRINITY_DN5536_c0_g1~~TRINITY_DN5536_c0_g1_i1.p1  ORF type:complete len:552 (-),score=238.15 TRINITY_DN5536_c0_g1_i1:276-1931(-)